MTSQVCPAELWEGQQKANSIHVGSIGAGSIEGSGSQMLQKNILYKALINAFAY